MGIVALRWQLCSLPLNSMIMTSNMLTQTCRMPVAANLLASARSGLFLGLFWSKTSAFFGLMGVEMCQAVSDVCSFLLTVPVMANTLSRLRGYSLTPKPAASPPSPSPKGEGSDHFQGVRLFDYRISRICFLDVRLYSLFRVVES